MYKVHAYDRNQDYYNIFKLTIFIDKIKIFSKINICFLNLHQFNNLQYFSFILVQIITTFIIKNFIFDFRQIGMLELCQQETYVCFCDLSLTLKI